MRRCVWELHASENGFLMLRRGLFDFIGLDGVCWWKGALSQKLFLRPKILKNFLGMYEVWM